MATRCTTISTLWTMAMKVCRKSCYRRQATRLINIPSDLPIAAEAEHIPQAYMFIFMFLVLFQLHHLSERTASTLISFVIMLVGAMSLPVINFPRTMTTIRQRIGFNELTAPIRLYVSCSTCHAVYVLADAPDTCTVTHLNATVCGNVLFKTTTVQGRQHQTPLKPFPYFPLRAGLEEL